MKRSGENEAMAHVFSRRTIVARCEGVERITNSVHVVEKLTDLATPCLRARESVVRHQIQAVRNIALKMQRQGVVTGAIVGAKNRNVGKIVSAIAVHSRLESVVRAKDPIGAEGVLSARGSVQRVGRVVIRIN